jgi:hypothetical protein
MGQWDIPDAEVEPWDNKQFVVETLEANERMGSALAYAYRKYPWIKSEIAKFLSEEGIEPPGIEEKVFVTYRRADGKPCFGEYGFMCDYDGLDEEESDIIEEHWVLEGTRVIPFPQEDDEFEDLYEEEEVGVRKFREGDR